MNNYGNETQRARRARAPWYNAIMDSVVDMQEVREYLNGNVALKAALGVDAAAELVPHFLGAGEHNLNYWFTRPECENSTGITAACEHAIPDSTRTDDGQKFVLRINVASQPFHENQTAYEFDALKAVETSGVAPRAFYLDDSPYAPHKGALVIGFCEGVGLDFDALQPGDLDQVARIMACIHTVDVAEKCPLFKPADPMRTLLDECLARFRAYRVTGLVEERFIQLTERLLEKACDQIDSVEHTAHPSIVNTEPLPSSFLICHDAESGEATGGSFIDWERAIVGDPAQDVAYFVAPTTTFWDSSYLMSPECAAEFVEAYWLAIDGRLSRDGFDERLDAWRALTQLRSMTWCCQTYANLQRDERMRLTEKARQKLTAYLSDDFAGSLWTQ